MLSNEKLNKILDEHIGKIGTFVEIGGYDGKTLSNTYHLANNNWKGYYFEPIIEYANKCYLNHKDNNVEVFSVGIGNEGLRQMYISEMLSTLRDADYLSKINQLEWFKDAQFTKKDVYIAPPTILPKCDFLVIDVEGAEHEIISKMTIRPKVLMIELHEESKEWQLINNIEPLKILLENMGYNKIYSDDVDSIFIYEDTHNRA